LVTLQRGIFKGLENLRTLLLNDCEIRNIDVNCFKPMKNLKILNISGNTLNIIYKSMFDSLEKLEKLFLKSSNVQIIERRAFSGLLCLKELDLSSNPISVISDSLPLDELTQLEKLNLTRCRNIKNCELKSLIRLTSLKELDLPDTFEEISSFISTDMFPNMEHVSLEAC